MTIRANSARSAELDMKGRTEVPADYGIRLLRDQLIVEPLETIVSPIIQTDATLIMKPTHGIVRAVGPGHYPKCYNGPKGKRTKSWDSKQFQPTECKVGDRVILGGDDIGGYSFQTFYWGDKMMLICREADVGGIVEP